MERISHIENKTAEQQLPQTNNFQDKEVINQQSESAHRAYAISKEFIPILEITQSLFGREFIDLSSVILNVLFHCNLKCLLSLRLTSTGFFKLISSESPVNFNYPCSPLSLKVAVSFPYSLSGVARDTLRQLREKSDFTDKEKTGIHIVMTVTVFVNPLMTLDTIEENKSAIILQIQTLNEIAPLQTLLSANSPRKFVDKIKEIDLEKLKINNNTLAPINGLLKTISDNITSLPNLTNLIFGDIENNTNFDLPTSAAFNCITKLIFGKIYYHASCNIPPSFCNLRSCSIGDIGWTSDDSFFKGLERPLVFPRALPYLVDLNIGEINHEVMLQLPLLNNLENLSIGYIQFDSSVKIPDVFPNLISLTLGNNNRSFTEENLRSFTSLRILTLLCVNNTLFNKVIPSIPELTILRIGKLKITDHVKYIIASQPKLSHLLIDEISTLGGLDIQRLSNISNLSLNITDLSVGITELFDKTMAEFEGEYNKIDLPKSLNHLTNLSLNGHQAILRLPTKVGNWKTFIIETPHDEKTRKLLYDINGKLNFIEKEASKTES